jgi:hypothetical protein
MKEGRILERTEFQEFSDGRPKAYMPEATAKAFPRYGKRPNRNQLHPLLLRRLSGCGSAARFRRWKVASRRSAGEITGTTISCGWSATGLPAVSGPTSRSSQPPSP